jgi:hypothetical protein
MEKASFRAMSLSETRYIIVGMPRSGTSVTHFCLRGHPSVAALREEVGVEPLLTQGLATFTFDHPNTKRGIPALFDAMTSVQTVSDPRARGIKVTTATERLARLFKEEVQSHLPDARIIHITRRDWVARFGSLTKAEKTGVWGRSDQSAPTLELDPYAFAEYVVESHQVFQALRSLRKTHDVFEVNYEDIILEGELPNHESLFEFVGVKPMKAEWLWEQKYSPPPESYIENYHDLKSLQGKIKSEIEQGRDPEVLRAEYARPLHKALLRKTKFWAQRPGYAAYRIEQAIQDWLDRRGEYLPG